MAAESCTYRDCPEPPVVRLQQSTGGTPWFGCKKHAPAMVKALHIGLSGATSGGASVEETPIKRRRR